MSAVDFLPEAAARWPDRTALIAAGCRLTYRELDAQSADRTARLASLGLAAGDAVGLFLLNGSDWIAWFTAMLRLGVIAMPINPAYTEAEVTRILETATPRAVVCEPRLAARVARVRTPVIDTEDAAPSARAWSSASSVIDAANPAVAFFSSGLIVAVKALACELARHAPRLGEHGVELLREANYSEDEIQAMTAEQVVRVAGTSA